MGRGGNIFLTLLVFFYTIYVQQSPSLVSLSVKLLNLAASRIAVVLKASCAAALQKQSTQLGTSEQLGS